MEIERLIEIVGNEPVFETGLLLAGNVNPVDVRRQLSRWTEAGKVWQLRRGLYTLAPPFQKVNPHPFLVANHLVRASYVSLQSALAHYGLIPEYVPVITSVTTKRPGDWDTPLGRYEFRHIKVRMFKGYKRIILVDGQEAFVAAPEKALLDLIYLQDSGDSEEYINELRLQNLASLDLLELKRQGDLSGSAKLKRAVAVISDLIMIEKKEYK